LSVYFLYKFMAKKLRVGVLMGGPSVESKVSLVTGQAVVNNLDKKKYIPTAIEMTKDSRFYLVKAKRYLDFINKDRKLFDIIFIALHGTPGEDGTVQGMFEALGICYTGANTLSSSLAMNKVFSAQVYFANKLPYPKFIHVKKDGWKHHKKEVLKEVRNKIKYPAVVKPVDQGSAVGVSIVKHERELTAVIDSTIKKFPWIMIQKFVAGDEATCGVLEVNGELLALPPTRIVANLGKFYDYASKYKPGGSTHICPADFPLAINKKIQKLALLAHKALRCRGMSRTDIFVAREPVSFSPSKSSGHETSRPFKSIGLYVLETNTIPGMTPTSLLPEAAAKAGISFSKMLDLIIKASLF